MFINIRNKVFLFDICFRWFVDDVMNLICSIDVI